MGLGPRGRRGTCAEEQACVSCLRPVPCSLLASHESTLPSFVFCNFCDEWSLGHEHFFTTLLPQFIPAAERRWKRSARIWAAFLVAGGAKGLQRPVLQRPETTSSPRHPATLTRCGVPRNAAGTRTRPRVAAQVRLHVACTCADDVLWACQGVQTVTPCVVKDVGRGRHTSGRGRRLQVLCAGVWALADFCIRVARLPLLPGMGARRSRLLALELVVAHCLLMCVRGRRRAYAGRHRGRAAPTCAAGCA